MTRMKIKYNKLPTFKSTRSPTIISPERQSGKRKVSNIASKGASFLIFKYFKFFSSFVTTAFTDHVGIEQYVS